MKRDYTLADIAAFLGAELCGDADLRISGLNSLADAGAGDLAFLANAKYKNQLASTHAGAVILGADEAEGFTGNCLILDDPI